jgi:tetratricopeptide (TPR) repeat protein
VYDALVHKLALEAPEEARDQLAARLATLEVRRSTTLKRVGALISAIASIERAISLAMRLPRIQTEAYVVLADLQAQRGHLPLARDAAERAIDLATESYPERLAWAYMVKGKAVFLAGEFDEAKQTFLRARQQAEAHGDRQHLSHIAGDVGSCCQALGDLAEAQNWTEQAVQLARERKQPALEASWLVELGKIRLECGDAKEADRLARAALDIAAPAEHRLTVFRAEWLRHRIVRRESPDASDASRVHLLEQLFRQLDQHEGIDEIVEFRDTILRARDAGG